MALDLKDKKIQLAVGLGLLIPVYMWWSGNQREQEAIAAAGQTVVVNLDAQSKPASVAAVPAPAPASAKSNSNTSNAVKRDPSGTELAGYVAPMWNPPPSFHEGAEPAQATETALADSKVDEAVDEPTPFDPELISKAPPQMMKPANGRARLYLKSQRYAFRFVLGENFDEMSQPRGGLNFRWVEGKSCAGCVSIGEGFTSSNLFQEKEQTFNTQFDHDWFLVAEAKGCEAALQKAALTITRTPSVDACYVGRLVDVRTLARTKVSGRSPASVATVMKTRGYITKVAP